MDINRSIPRPLHEQIAETLQQAISSGRWPPHYQLPAEPDLARQFQVSRGTLRHALKKLIDKGLLVQVHGKGTFVAASASIEQPFAQVLVSLAEGLEQQGLSFRTEVLSVGLVPAEGNSALLGVEPGDNVFRLVRRRSVSGVWVAYLVNYVRADLCPGLEQYDFTERRMFDLLEQEYHLSISWARRTFEAQVAKGIVAETLEVSSGTPILYLEQLTYLENSMPVEYSDVWIRGDKLKLSSMVKRSPGGAESGSAEL